jgi:uncharacterized protein
MSKACRTSLIFPLLLLGAIGSSGCMVVVPFGKVKALPPDPLRKQVVKVVAVEGTTVALADGRKLRLAGMETTGLSARMALRVQEETAKALVGREVYPMIQPDGRAILLGIDPSDKTRYCGEGSLMFSKMLFGDQWSEPNPWPPVAMFPIVVTQPLVRPDFNQSLLRQGLGRADVGQPSDRAMRDAYVKAAKEAAEKRLGLWIDEAGLAAVFARQGNWDRVIEMLDEGLSIEARDERGITALMYAAGCPEFDIKGRADMVRLLLDRGADPNAVGDGGRRPLHFGIRQIEVLQLLLDHGAKVDGTDISGSTVLHYAVGGGRWCLPGLADSYRPEAVRFLIKAGANVNLAAKDGCTPLQMAAGLHDGEIVKLLLANGAKPNVADKKGWTPLMRAVNPGVASVRTLVEAGADVNYVAPVIPKEDFRTALQWAVHLRKYDVTEYLVANGADINAPADGTRPLVEAIYSNDVKMLRLLLDHGADVNFKDKGGQTPLQRFSQYPKETLAVLKAYGAK